MSTPEELTVKTWQPWMDKSTDAPMRDEHGNYRGSVTFEELTGEVADATFKSEAQPGDKKFGVVEEYKTRAGNVRLRFKRYDRPQEGATPAAGATVTNTSSGWRDDSAIRAQWAINAALQAIGKNASGVHADYFAGIETYATKFYAMVDRIKAPAPAAAQSGYEKAKETRNAIAGTFNNGEPLPHDEPINLDEIPF